MTQEELEEEIRRQEACDQGLETIRKEIVLSQEVSCAEDAD